MVADHDSGLQSECCTEVTGSGRKMGTQADESDAVLPDQHPGHSHWTVSTVVLTSQCPTPCLCMACVNTGKDCGTGSGPLGLEEGVA